MTPNIWIKLNKIKIICKLELFSLDLNYYTYTKNTLIRITTTTKRGKLFKIKKEINQKTENEKEKREKQNN